MKDIGDKPDSKRTAVAEAVLTFPAELTELLREGRTEKGDALAMGRTAGIMAAKKTSDIIPLCHPLPLTHAEVEPILSDGRLVLRVTVATVGPTGVEMEALTGASVAALTVYDMLKPHSTDLAIETTRLLDKRGGKSGMRVHLDPPARARVIVLSDRVSRGDAGDRAGATVAHALEGHGVVVAAPTVLPDDPEKLRAEVSAAVEDGVDLVVTVGGTGLGPRDATVEAIAPMLDRELPGVVEAMRQHGQRRVRTAMLGRGIAGVVGRTVVVTLPGSTGGAREGCAALFPPLLHAIEVLRGAPHPGGYAG